ncbi:hypothetical protein ACJJIW_08900 [Microbulbifer sp. JMSA004]|uniref:hypothetical protein n=1 Tax=Microbulbifer sp. JMSA004 TaxID=3243370 RepID=UPI004039B778
MFKKTDEGYELARFGELTAFISILCEQYKVYSDFIHKRPDIDSLCPEEIVRLNHNQIDPLYISTIFSAMFLEAYIFDYGARKSSGAYIKNYIDKLDPPSKWLVVTKLFNDQGIEPSSQCFEVIKKLFKVRNQLAHNKSKEFDGLDKLAERKSDLFKPVECVDLLIKVMDELFRIDPDELYAKQTIDKLNKLKDEYPA